MCASECARVCESACVCLVVAVCVCVCVWGGGES